jgi:outer membrane protein OmpA-like peptidoglycan-associated protein
MAEAMRKTRMGIAAVAMAALSLGTAAATAQQLPSAQALIDWGVWVAPDGCMYWYADGGIEGYMLDRVDPETGLPVCLQVDTCLVAPTDTLFPTDGYTLTAEGHRRLLDFFRTSGAFSYSIYGHTDARASLEYNQALSERRANAVYQVAREAGVVVERVIGFGETRPRATNSTAEGMTQNRRVEIVCYRW